MRLFLRSLVLRTTRGVWVLCLLVFSAFPVCVASSAYAWDLRVYDQALQNLRAGNDPYTAATSIQKQHNAGVIAQDRVLSEGSPPYAYVYPPITLIVLRALCYFPRALLMSAYWILYCLAILAAFMVALSFAHAAEFPGVFYLATLAVFFPGLLANGTILGGNLVYILYGAVLVCAWVGWHYRIWWPFYIVVLCSGCVKLPLLSLILIAPLSSKRQWTPALGVAGFGVAVFALQFVLWPALFRHYLEAVELLFRYNHDFGCGPAGLISNELHSLGYSYLRPSAFVYAAYALPVFGVLVCLSRRSFEGAFSLQDWAPVLLTGVILLNPRIIEYDLAPVMVPMALLAWRTLSGWQIGGTGVVVTATAFLAMNAVGLYSWDLRKELDGMLLTCIFAAGCWHLWRKPFPP